MTKPKPMESFRFRLGTGDDDLRQFLESVPERERSQTVKHLIRTALSQTKRFDTIDAGLNLILQTLTKFSQPH